jgi:hypothetical protein
MSQVVYSLRHSKSEAETTDKKTSSHFVRNEIRYRSHSNELIHHITSHSGRKGEEVRITGVCEKGEGKTTDFDDSYSVMASTICEKVH